MAELVYDDSFVITKLITEIPPFERFWQSNAQRLNYPRGWQFGKEAFVQGATFTDGNKGVVITSPGMPLDLGSAKVTAHELLHHPYTLQGYPLLRSLAISYEPIRALCVALAFMEEALIERELCAYFPVADLRIAQDPTAAQFEHQKESVDSDAANSLNRTLEVIHFTYRTFVWTAISEKDLPSLKIYQEKNPTIAAEGLALCQEVRERGWESPAQQRAILADLIQRYKLDGFIEVVSHAN